MIEEALASVQIINENTTNLCRFNVMPNKFVEETIFIKQYRIYEDAIEASFTRQYSSSMLKSPDHFIFLTALIHTQKMIYIYLCHKFDITYDPYADEKLKIWPTKVDVDLPKLVTDSAAEQRLEIISLIEVKEKQYVIEVINKTADRIQIRAICNIYLL